MLTRPEIFEVVNDFIGGSGGYLGDFSYKTHEEFYPHYCGLDISTQGIEGTTRNRFLHIIGGADDITQAKILRGVLIRYPLHKFGEEEKERKAQIASNIERMISRLEGNAVAGEELHVTNATVEAAINDAKILIERSGATSGVDRIHTALHGYLKEVARQAGIPVDDDNMMQLLKKLKVNHPALNTGGARQEEINQILISISNALDKLNTIRNNASLAHPNENLLEQDEAHFVINSAQSVLNYLNRKFKN